MRLPLRGQSAAVGVLEATHADAPSLQLWMDRVAQAVGHLIGGDVGASASLLGRCHDRYRVLELGASGYLSDIEVQRFDSVFARFERGFFDRFMLSPVATLSEVARRADPKEMARWLEESGIQPHGDQCALCTFPSRSDFMVVSTLYDRPITMTQRDRHLLTRVTAHIEAGARARLFPESIVALLRPDGRVEHWGDDLARVRRDRLQAHVTTIERSRTRQRRSSRDALDLWTALVAGRYGFLERSESDGRRHYVVVSLERASSKTRFSPREAKVVELSARGLAGKSVAYALGLSDAAVSTTLRSAALKAGCRSRAALIQLASRLLQTAPALQPTKRLSRTEREVLALVQRGLSNEAIAEARERSVHTVANQISNLLRKLEVPTRRALAAGLEIR